MHRAYLEHSILHDYHAILNQKSGSRIYPITELSHCISALEMDVYVALGPIFFEVTVVGKIW